MSRLLHLLNRLKGEAHENFLTGSQHAAMTEILKHWKIPERINLVGAQGVGKTFLGWVFAGTQDGDFVESATLLPGYGPDADRPLVVDNAPSDERPLRALLAELQLRDVRSALMISRKANRLGLPVVELDLPTRKDIDVVYHNLSLLEYYALEPLVQGNLWQVIYSTLTVSGRRGAI